MAHDKDKKSQVRKSYVFDGLSLASCAMLCGRVVLDCPTLEKRSKGRRYDDWDKLKISQYLGR